MVKDLTLETKNIEREIYYLPQVSQQQFSLSMDTTKEAVHVRKETKIENQSFNSKCSHFRLFQSNFKYNMNLAFIITEDPKYRHRAIQLRPHVNLTGDWMCSVSTYHTRDRKIKSMKIIGRLLKSFKELLIISSLLVPEKSFELYHHDMNFYLENSKVFLIICSVTKIFPEPSLSLMQVSSQFSRKKRILK